MAKRRIISGVRPLIPADSGRPGSLARRTNLVIADWGTTAELVVFPVGEPVARGAEFRYRGTLWVITNRRRDSRIMVAEPTSH